MEITFYQTTRGNTPVKKFIENLDESTAEKIAAVILDIEQNGLEGPTVEKRQVQGKLWELKVWQQRIFYTVISGPQMVLLHACKKQGKKARKEDLSTAKSRLAKLNVDV